MSNLKVFKGYNVAKKNANGLPIVKIGQHYLVLDTSLIGLKITEVSLINPDGYTTGTIIMGHLDRLGNANYAEVNPKMCYSKTCFPKENEV